MQVLDKPANRQRGCAHAAGEFDHSISRRDRVGIKGILDRSVKAKHPAAREAQLSRIAEVQDQVAAAFSHRCKNDLTAHVLAALTLSALSLTHRVWFAKGKKDLESAAQQVFSALAKVIHEERPGRHCATLPPFTPTAFPPARLVDCSWITSDPELIPST